MNKLVEEYDVKTNEWIQSTDMPQNMALFSAETVNGKIYLVGGTGKQHTFNSLNTTLEYNPISTINEPAWVLMNNLDPGGLTCIVDTLIYSFGGGWEGRNIGEDVKSYNTVTNEWNELTPMPMPWIEGGIGLIGDKIYLAGGWTGDWVTTDSIMEYDIAIDTFVFKKKNPQKIGSSASCVMNEKIYLFGGWGDPFPNVSYPYDALNYDPVNEQWNNLPDMNFPHLMHATAEVIDENIYVLGGVGLGPNHTPQQPEKFDGEKWEFIAEMPIPVTLHKSVVHNNKIIVFGGDSLWTQSHSYSTNFIQEYDPATDTWRIMEPMPFQRSAMFGGKVGNYVFLTGGNVDDRDPLTFVPEVWRFNLDSLKVKAAGPVPGIAKTKANQMVLVYPNPANDILHIKVPNQFQNEFELRLISITGKVFCHKYGFIKQIDISGIPPGAYLISVKSKDFVTTKKIIKQ